MPPGHSAATNTFSSPPIRYDNGHDSCAHDVAFKDSGLPTVDLGLKEGRNNLWGKTKAAFKYLYEASKQDSMSCSYQYLTEGAQ